MLQGLILYVSASEASVYLTSLWLGRCFFTPFAVLLPWPCELTVSRPADAETLLWYLNFLPDCCFKYLAMLLPLAMSIPPLP